MIFIYFWSVLIKNLDTAVLRMPYKGENNRFSMYIFLPDKSRTAIDDLLKELSPTILDDVFNGTYLETEVYVSFPKFSFEQTSELEKVFKKCNFFRFSWVIDNLLCFDLNRQYNIWAFRVFLTELQISVVSLNLQHQINI